MSGTGYLGPTGGSAGGTVTGTFPTAGEIAKSVELEAGNNFVVGTSKTDGRTLIARSQADNDAISIYEINGTTLVADQSDFSPASAGTAVEAFQYMGTLTTGTYNLAAIKALMAGSDAIIGFHAYMVVGSGSVTSASGGIVTLGAGASFERPASSGSFISDIELVVDAASSANVHFEGIA